MTRISPGISPRDSTPCPFIGALAFLPRGGGRTLFPATPSAEWRRGLTRAMRWLSVFLAGMAPLMVFALPPNSSPGEPPAVVTDRPSPPEPPFLFPAAPGGLTKRGETLFRPVRIGDRYGFHTGTATGPWGRVDENGDYQVFPLWERVAGFRHGFAPVRVNGRWGFIDTAARQVIAPRFDAIWQSPTEGLDPVLGEAGSAGDDSGGGDPLSDWTNGFAPGVFPVREGGEWVLAASTGALLPGPRYTAIDEMSEERALVTRPEGMGFVDPHGVLVIPGPYEEAGAFQEGRAAVRRNGRWGYIDREGREVIPPKFSRAHGFQNGQAVVEEDGVCLLIDRAGHLLASPTYDQMECLAGGDTFIVCRQNKAGLFQTGRGEILAPDFDFLAPLQDNLLLSQDGGREGLVDRSGKILLPCRYDRIVVDDPDLYILQKNGMLGFFHPATGRVTEPRYQAVEPVTDGLAAVRDSEGRWGYVDATGHLVIPPVFDWAGPFRDGRAAVSLGGEVVFIDPQGSRLPADLPTAGEPPLPGGLRRVEVNGRFGFVDTTGRFVLRPAFRAMRTFASGSLLLLEGDLWSMYGPDGRELHPATWTAVGLVREDRCWVSDGRATGFVDGTGRLVVPLRYDQARDFVEGRAAVRRGAKWGFLDREGREVVPPRFDEVTDYSKGSSKARSGVKRGRLTYSGAYLPLTGTAQDDEESP